MKLTYSEAIKLLTHDQEHPARKFDNASKTNAEIYRLQTALGIQPTPPVFNLRAAQVKIVQLMAEAEGAEPSLPAVTQSTTAQPSPEVSRRAPSEPAPESSPDKAKYPLMAQLAEVQKTGDPIAVAQFISDHSFQLGREMQNNLRENPVANRAESKITR